MMTQNWALPAPPHLVAINVDAVDAAKNYEMDAGARRRRRRGGPLRWPSALPQRDGLDDARARAWPSCAPSARAALASRVPATRSSSSTRRARRARRRRRVRRHVHPRLLAGRAHPRAGPARARLPDGLGHARLRPSRSRSARRWRGAGPVVACRRRRHALRAAASWRPSPRSGSRSPRSSSTTAATGCCASTSASRATRLRRGPQTPRLRGARGGVRHQAETVEGLGDDFGEALARHVADSSPPCWWRVRGWSRRPPRSPRWYRRRK